MFANLRRGVDNDEDCDDKDDGELCHSTWLLALEIILIIDWRQGTRKGTTQTVEDNALDDSHLIDILDGDAWCQTVNDRNNISLQKRENTCSSNVQQNYHKQIIFSLLASCGTCLACPNLLWTEEKTLPEKSKTKAKTSSIFALSWCKVIEVNWYWWNMDICVCVCGEWGWLLGGTA